MKRTLGVFLMLMVSGMMGYAVADENIKFSGTLVSLPCTISGSDLQIPVHFGAVNAHELYLGQTMPRIPFVLHLEDCDPSISDRVNVTFTGIEDQELPGLLKLDSSKSVASGVAIGLENTNGDKISLHKSTQAYVLQQGSNQLAFRAYIAGEPAAIKQRLIQTGEFSAMAVLELSYE